jgi:hypothetical protein
MSFPTGRHVPNPLFVLVPHLHLLIGGTGRHSLAVEIVGHIVNDVLQEICLMIFRSGTGLLRIKEDKQSIRLQYTLWSVLIACVSNMWRRAMDDLPKIKEIRSLILYPNANIAFTTDGTLTEISFVLRLYGSHLYPSKFV